MFGEVVQAREQLAELVGELDPHAVSTAASRQLWGEFNRIERLAAGAKTLLAGRVAQTHQPQQSGTKTAAEDLARKAGTSTGSAKDTIATSQRLTDQPGVAGALRRGELSPAQAAAISGAVAANPSAVIDRDLADQGVGSYAAVDRIDDRRRHGEGGATGCWGRFSIGPVCGTVHE